MKAPENIKQLESSLSDLHASVARLIEVIQNNAHHLEQAEAILNKLPILDFYNDDLRRNIEAIRDQAR